MNHLGIQHLELTNGLDLQYSEKTTNHLREIPYSFQGLDLWGDHADLKIMTALLPCMRGVCVGDPRKIPKRENNLSHTLLCAVW